MTRPSVVEMRKLLYWMEERQRIYLKRQKGEPWPWTADPILRRYKFCNTYREQDRVTVWIRKNWREPFALHPNLWFAMCLARMINWPDTLEEIGFPEKWEPKRVVAILLERAKRDLKVFTGAYLLGGGVQEGVGRAFHMVWNVLDPLYKNPGMDVGIYNTLQTAHAWMVGYKGWGRFLAYEVITDLRHTRYLCDAFDIDSWASIGPGAKRGLNRIYRRDLRASGSPEKLLEEMQVVMKQIRQRREIKLLPYIEARDVEHSLCEFDKYCRVTEREESGAIVGLDRYQPRLV